jgi:Core-2/I-Branching enzyme
MKVAFLILNHRDAPQLLRLIATLRHDLPDCPVVVHQDRFSFEIPRQTLGRFENTYLLTAREPIRWGDFTLVDAIWQSLQWMLENLEFDWVQLLSAQDYPIKPLAEFPKYLAASGTDAFVRADPIHTLATAAERRNRRRRYLYQYRSARADADAALLRTKLRRVLRKTTPLLGDIINNLQPFVQISKLPDGMPWRIGFRSGTTPFTDDRPCWFGSVWMTLSMHATRALISASHSRPEYVSYLRRTIQPDESATASLLCNDPSVQVTNHSLHYVRWTHPESGHPDLLNSGDLDELLAADGFFARKFDIGRDAKILDWLDQAALREQARA